MMLTAPFIERKTFRVLHLDPGSADTALMSDALASERYLELVTVATMAEFEEAIHSRTFDIVISSDTVLDQDRLDVVQRVRQVSPATEILVLGERDTSGSPTDAEAPVYVARSGGLPIRVRNAIHCALSRLNLSLELEQARFERQLFQGLSQEMHAVMDCSCCFEQASFAAKQLLNFSEDELCGRYLLDVVAAEERPRVQYHLESLQRSMQKTIFRTTCTVPHSSCRWIEWSLVRNPQAESILVVARNVTDQVQMERILLRQTEARARLLDLSELEQKVLEQVVEGLPNKVIASRMSCSEKTVERYRSSGMKRLSLRNVPSLTRLFMTADLVDNLRHGSQQEVHQPRGENFH